ncbi:hypothetical protein [Brachybacterium hainanense]|uniref:Uncharacterized protein n=1 Tax=Brachybacterium hainanense TaxID=1541174 RepID=A0ABV6RAG4_9MICO
MALALHSIEQEDEANRCPVCGGDKRTCQDPKNQRAYEAGFKRCYASRAVGWAMKARGDDADARALVAYTTFHPERVKPD